MKAPTRSGPARLALGLSALLLVGGLLGFFSVAEQAVEYEPWIDPLPENAVSQGYWSFKDTEGGWGVPGYADWWMERSPPRGDGPIISDRRHASKQPEEDRLGLEDYGYTQMHGLSRAFDPARTAGVRIEPTYDVLTPGRLGGASMVFINLVSGDNPGFRHSEVLALESFVRHGGGLVLITDHTNCYFSAEMLQPLQDAFGFDVVPATACEMPPHTLSPRSHAWARMTVPGDHVTGEGVEVLGWMNGGIVRPREGSGFVPVMSNSETGWEDRTDPYRKPDSAGFTGSLRQEEGEPSGPHPVVIAGEYGQGRIVVLADQNAWGSTLVGYEDNAQMFTNALSWTTGQVMPLELRGPESVTTVSGPKSLCTSAATNGFRTLQVQLQRLSEHHLVPEFCTLGRPVSSKSVMVLPEANHPDLESILDGAERALILVDAEHPGHLALLGLEQAPLGGESVPGGTLSWQGFAVQTEHKVMKGAGEDAIVSKPVALALGDYQVLAVNDQNMPVLVSLMRGQTVVLLLLDAQLLSNRVIGGERDDPTKKLNREFKADKAPGVTRDERLSGYRLAWRLGDWLFQ
ncbi:MAG: hypothetical protein ACI9VR_004992 [Cognaticolwellia sp.]|jgi:hypothetical protein